MPKLQRVDYWDACLFVAYLNGEPERADMLDALLAEVERTDGRRVATSAFTSVEVTHLAYERTAGQLDPQVEGLIDAFMSRPSVVTVEVSAPVIGTARRLIRRAVARQLQLKPADAIHIATAMWLKENGINVERFFTYDDRLMRFSELAGISIGEPIIEQLRLDLSGIVGREETPE